MHDMMGKVLLAVGAQRKDTELHVGCPGTIKDMGELVRWKGRVWIQKIVQGEGLWSWRFVGLKGSW